MSAADEAYRAAVEEIERVRAEGGTSLALRGEQFRALTRVPSEIEGWRGLQSLNLWRTKISDITALAGLTGLQSLDLMDTEITDITALAGLTALQSLALTATKISDLTALAGLTALQSLDLAATKISDFTALAGLTGLQRLNLMDTQITDAGLARVAGLTELQGLFLSRTQITDAGLAQVTGLTGLQSLYLWGTKITDAGLVHVARLTGLQGLFLSQTQITDAGLAHVAGLTGLQSLDLSGTQITDAGLAHVAGLTGLQSLDLSDTQITDAGLAHVVGLAGLQSLSLTGTLVRDLRPICDLPFDRVGNNALLDIYDLQFANTPAANLDETLGALAGIEDNKERMEKTLAYLRGLPKYPAPLPWTISAPTDADVPPIPEEDKAPRIHVGEKKIDLDASPIDEADLTDPIKARIYAKLPDAVAALQRFTNRFPEVKAPVDELQKLVAVSFEDADLLDIHLQLAHLTDLHAADGGKPAIERLDPECLAALNNVLRLGPAVTLGHPDVDLLEARSVEYERNHLPITVAEAERIISKALADQPDIATERLQKTAGSIAAAGDVGRVAQYRRAFTRNAVRALGIVAAGLVDAAQGFVYGELLIASAKFLMLYKDAIMATAPAWGQTGAAWLEYVLYRAKEFIEDAQGK